MKKLKEKNSIEKIKTRASKNLRIYEVYLDTDLELEAIQYLKKQRFLEFSKIETVLKNNFIPSYPFGYVLKNQENTIVGFMGTIFSIRNKGNRERIFCNIHTWIVDEAYRLNSFLLLTEIAEKKITLTAFTPVKTLIGLLEKFGFQKITIKYRITFLIDFFKFFRKSKYKIEKNSINIEKILNENDLITYKSYIHVPCEKFLIIDINDKTKYIFIIASKVIKRKFNTLNIFYVSNNVELKKNWNKIYPEISKEFKVNFCIQHFFDETDSAIPNKLLVTKNSKKNICVKNVTNNFKLDILYSDLIE